MQIPAKELAIIFYLALGYRAVGERVASLGVSASLGFYLGLFSVIALSIVAAAYVRNRYLRFTYALLLSGSSLFLDTSELILGDHLTYDQFITLLNSVESAGEAAEQYRAALLSALPAALLLFAGVALKPRRMLSIDPRFLGAGPALGVGVLAIVLYLRGGEGARGLPSAIPPLAYSSVYLYETATGVAGPRQLVTISPRKREGVRDVILIVDESVTANYLDINHPAGVRSGLKEARAGVAIYNYGYAASVTNCSVGTNLTLHYGGTRADYQRINATMPSIWDYAKKAGFRLAYVDAQRTHGELHGLMPREELRSVEKFIQFDNLRVRYRDMAAADKLAEFLSNDQADFVIVNKVGAHFPIHDKYPDEFLRHLPALPRGKFAEISDTGSRKGFGGSAEDWRRYRNAYRNTLLWNVGAFFDRLFAKADFSRATLIYTSDHGQDLHERGGKGLNTHCSSDPVQQEGLVPLVVVEGAGLKALDWSRNLGRNRNRSSHFQVFPTMLALMGYDPADVRPTYGDSLIPVSRDDLSFNVLFNARLGRQPVWRRIELRRIAAPPAD